MEQIRIRLPYNTIFKSFISVFFLLLFGIFIYSEVKLTVGTMFLLVLATLFFFPTKNSIIKIVAFVYYCIMFVLLSLNIVEFNFIPQAKTLLDVNDNLFHWFSIGNPHAVRLLVAYPGYIISKIYDIDLNPGFSYYGIFLFMMLYLVLANIIAKFNCKKNIISINIKCLLLLIPLIILTFIMNGRLISSFLGYAILIDIFMSFFNSDTKISIYIILKYLIGLILTMVSSGTMTVAIVYTLIIVYGISYKRINKRKVIKTSIVFLLVFSPLIYRIFDYFLLMLNRNLIHFGGGYFGFINMLNHGLGRVFLSNRWILPLVFILGLIIVSFNVKMILKKMKKRDIALPVVLAINIAAYGILFGFSTGLMMVPPLFIYILIRI